MNFVVFWYYFCSILLFLDEAQHQMCHQRYVRNQLRWRDVRILQGGNFLKIRYEAIEKPSEIVIPVFRQKIRLHRGVCRKIQSCSGKFQHRLFEYRVVFTARNHNFYKS